MKVTEIFLQIIGFHNCKGCMKKVRETLGKIDGVELVRLEPESGNVTVTTTIKHPEVIKEALRKRMKKNVDIHGLREIVLLPTYQNPNHHQLPFDSNGNYSHSNAQRVSESGGNYYNPTRYSYGGGHMIKDMTTDHNTRPIFTPPAWQAAVEPSAPPMPEEEGSVVYGYPLESYGFSSASFNSRHYHDHW